MGRNRVVKLRTEHVFHAIISCSSHGSHRSNLRCLDHRRQIPTCSVQLLQVSTDSQHLERPKIIPTVSKNNKIQIQAPDEIDLSIEISQFLLLLAALFGRWQCPCSSGLGLLETQPHGQHAHGAPQFGCDGQTCMYCTGVARRPSFRQLNHQQKQNIDQL